jgi:hypothetical protein
MREVHCGTCGGVIGDLAKVSYRLPNRGAAELLPGEGRCECPVPVVYGPPAGFASMPTMPSAGPVQREPGAKLSRGPRRWS